MKLTASLDTSNTQDAFNKRARGFKKGFLETRDDIGRLVAISLATSAQPYGAGSDALKAGQAAVHSQIYRIYCTPQMVYGTILNASAGREIANAFYRALRATAYSTAIGIMRAYTPQYSTARIGQFDGGAAHRQRRNNRGRISKSQKPVLLVTNPHALQEYVRIEMDKVGFGKAGWANCAKAFRSGRAATRGLPGWVTRHKTAPAEVALSGEGEGQVMIAMANLVPYSQGILDAGDKRAAIESGIARWYLGCQRAEREAAAKAPLL